MALPDYACALIEDGHDRLLLELRPVTSAHAAGQLTCFGGKREADEDATGCLMRELREELDWEPTAAEPACDLWRGDRWIARFFRCRWHATRFRTEPDHVALWVPWSSLPGLPVSPWHRAVLAAIRDGRQRVALDVSE